MVPIISPSDLRAEYQEAQRACAAAAAGGFHHLTRNHWLTSAHGRAEGALIMSAISQRPAVHSPPIALSTALPVAPGYVDMGVSSLVGGGICPVPRQSIHSPIPAHTRQSSVA